jgi:hypothetical protein
MHPELRGDFLDWGRTQFTTSAVINTTTIMLRIVNRTCTRGILIAEPSEGSKPNS